MKFFVAEVTCTRRKSKRTEYKIGGKQEIRKRSQSKSRGERLLCRVHLWEVRESRA